MGFLSGIGLGDNALGGLVNAATLGLSSIAGTLLGNKQSAGYNKQMAFLQQAFAERNAAIAHQYELDTLAKTGCQSATQQYNAYKYDKRLAKYSQELQALSSQQDYDRAIKYIADSQAAYKQALVANGYNPILALSSSIPSYGGHTNAASIGSVSAPVGHASTVAKPTQGSIPSAPYSDYGASLTSGMAAALNFARVASDVKRNESASIADRARAAKDLESAKTDVEHRDPVRYKVYSDTAKNIVGTAGSAAGGVVLANQAGKLFKAVKSGSVKAAEKAAAPIVEKVATEGNSAFLGSRVLQSVMPVLFGAPAAYGTGKAIENYNKKNRTLSEQFSKPNPFIATGFGL